MRGPAIKPQRLLVSLVQCALTYDRYKTRTQRKSLPWRRSGYQPRSQGKRDPGNEVVWISGVNLDLSYDPYGPASASIAKPSIKVPYEGRTHLRERGQKTPYGPTTKAYGLAY